MWEAPLLKGCKFFNCSIICFKNAALAAEWFFIAVLSAAMEKEILLSVLCVSSEAGG